ncbi:MAG: hypothetical protein IKI09_00705 [Bacteroidales bacterium]|nr:hypothetical protein [Bacteroidales bacterium]
MENNENNNLSELDQLKAQYETLKQQFDQQEIVNDRLMKSSIKQGTDFYRRNRMRSIIMCPLAAIFGLLGIKLWFGNNLSLSLFWVAFMFTCLVIELVLTRKFQRKTLGNDDLLVLSHTARSFKKLFSVFTVLNYSTGLILVCGLLMSLVGTNYNGGPMMLTFLAVVVGMIVLGISEVRYKTRPCDEIIRQIDASDNTIINRKTGIDRKQRWFCVAMLVAFIGLDIWAYTIVGTYLKLPPMWRTVEYVRADNDFSTEGKLAIWEVFADTVVPEKDVPEMRQALSVLNDSYVLMEDSSDEVRLYVLKKNSQEGPAISSAILGGKPMVKKIVVTKPCKYPSNGSIPMIVVLTPEASQLWHEYTKRLTGKRGAVSIDGVVVQEWKIMRNLDNGCFFIMREWSSKEELEAFCEQLIRQ